jgi:hypothetical protein
MSVNRRKRRLPPAQPAVSENPPRGYGWLFPFALGSIVAGVIVFAASHRSQTESNVRAPKALTATTTNPDYPTLGELACMSDDELRRQDLALVNLRCAEGLPGSEDLSTQKCLATLDQWTQRVRFETERHLYRAHDPRYSKHYRNSEAY